MEETVQTPMPGSSLLIPDVIDQLQNLAGAGVRSLNFLQPENPWLCWLQLVQGFEVYAIIPAHFNKTTHRLQGLSGAGVQWEHG